MKVRQPPPVTASMKDSEDALGGFDGKINHCDCVAQIDTRHVYYVYYSDCIILYTENGGFKRLAAAYLTITCMDDISLFSVSYASSL